MRKMMMAALLPFAALPLLAQSKCGPEDSVLVDCKTHQIELTIGGQKKKADINCGRPGLTKNGTGRIGSPIPTTNVGEAVNIEGLAGMGAPPPQGMGDGEVFHLPPPVHKPTKIRKANISLGCIHVNAEILDILKQCRGAQLEIRGAAAGSGGRYSAPMNPGGVTGGGGGGSGSGWR